MLFRPGIHFQSIVFLGQGSVVVGVLGRSYHRGRGGRYFADTPVGL